MKTNLLLATLLLQLFNSPCTAAIKQLNFVGEFDVTEPSLVSAIGSTLSYEGYMRYDDSVAPAVTRSNIGFDVAFYPYDRFSITLAGQTLSAPGDSPGEIQNAFDNAIEIRDSAGAISDTVSFRAGRDGAFAQDVLINGNYLTSINFYLGSLDLSTANSGTSLSIFETFPTRNNRTFNLHFTLDGQQLSLSNSDEFGYTIVTVPEPSGLCMVAGLSLLSLRWRRR